MTSASDPDDGDQAPGPVHLQRLASLVHANQIRSERAAVKARLRYGEVEVAQLITDPPRCLASASLAEILSATPGVGTVGLRRLLGATRLSPAKRIGSLTERQRQELARALGRRR